MIWDSSTDAQAAVRSFSPEPGRGSGYPVSGHARAIPGRSVSCSLQLTVPKRGSHRHALTSPRYRKASSALLANNSEVGNGVPVFRAIGCREQTRSRERHIARQPIPSDAENPAEGLNLIQAVERSRFLPRSGKRREARLIDQRPGMARVCPESRLIVAERRSAISACLRLGNQPSCNPGTTFLRQSASQDED